jgi:HTH-type transcriptional regulator, sugar sensing transcriptional regulator
MDEYLRRRIQHHKDFGVEVRYLEGLPMKLALFDAASGLVALLDPVMTKPSWTAVVFEHKGFAEAMSGLFESYWARAAKDHDTPTRESAAGLHHAT